MSNIDNPLTASSPKEVPLSNAPLVRVIARINFPAVVSIGKAEFIAPFQEALRSSYPVLRPDQTMAFFYSGGPNISNSPGGSIPGPQITWRFSDTTGDWRVSLATNFVALETTKYLSRADFLNRLTVIADALAEHVNPQVIDRVGVRYIDRVITTKLTKNIAKYVRPEVVGVLASKMANSVQHAMCESVFEIPKEKTQLLARWGHMPKNATVDPAAIEPIDQPSWILDLDMFNPVTGPFSSKGIVGEVRAYSERIYTFFRWAVTDEFLKFYGGHP